MRLHALNNRGPRRDVGQLSYADIVIDISTDKVSRAGLPVKLSRTQLKILKLLIKNAPGIVSRKEIVQALWGDESPDSDSLRSHVYGLRTALDKGFSEPCLETLHGKGYRIKA
ncbi:winged helix-turn-helix domain-containing protein [Shewanella woodyi]|uniref:winged helix-turn-helix domain-containing protein n=1 Tax=Shewanella woodyi TaxID=60961 RepID=UPI003749B923